jgi:hypothetical protein
VATSARGGPPVVFLGPTLETSEASAILDAVYLPPAVQGSVVRAVARYRPSAILLIDGGFQSEPAVRHKEILWALSVGVPVIGAASMGALRAAELWPHGMRGIGVVFRWYRRHPFAPDDAVAVLQGPPELGARPLTRALVDLRLTFRLAERGGALAPDMRRRLETAAQQLNFRDRTLDRVVEFACAGGAPPQLAPRLRRLFVSQKRNDALQALAWLKAQHPIIQKPDPAQRQFRVTAAFLRDLEDAGIAIPPLHPEPD